MVLQCDSLTRQQHSLDLFRFTVRSLAQALGGNADVTPSETILSHPKICKVLVVDDGSSETDREAMRAEFPAFQFVMKVGLLFLIPSSLLLWCTYQCAYDVLNSS